MVREEVVRKLREAGYSVTGDRMSVKVSDTYKFVLVGLTTGRVWSPQSNKDLKRDVEKVLRIK